MSMPQFVTHFDSLTSSSSSSSASVGLLLCGLSRECVSATILSHDSSLDWFWFCSSARDAMTAVNICCYLFRQLLWMLLLVLLLLLQHHTTITKTQVQKTTQTTIATTSTAAKTTIKYCLHSRLTRYSISIVAFKSKSSLLNICKDIKTLLSWYIIISVE